MNSKLPSHSGRTRRKLLNRLLENDLIRRVSFEEYREKIRQVYGGPQGAFLAACSLISLHAPLGQRLIRKRKFDLRGARRILDVGSGAGQIARHLLHYADPQASITCMDLSEEMLRRARRRLKSPQPRLVAADMSHLPFAEGTFDCVTCGYVLEHLPEAKIGLAELSRVTVPGAKILLFATEDTFSGAWTSRLWRCRTYNRRELARVCEEAGLQWHRELWFTRLHRMFRAGGICVELVKR
jgi:ubiquinone/menaquinone biosynthesis C-methylase UbiE